MCLVCSLQMTGDIGIFHNLSYLLLFACPLLSMCRYSRLCRGGEMGSGKHFLIFESSTYFTEGRMDLPREAIGPEGSNCFSKGVQTSISKETCTNL